MVGADGVYPCVDLGCVDVKPAVEFGTGLGDHLSLTGDPALAVGFGLGMRGAVGMESSCVHAAQYSLARGQLPALANASPIGAEATAWRSPPTADWRSVADYEACNGAISRLRRHFAARLFLESTILQINRFGDRQLSILVWRAN
jgi:hypothetical protein